jgi:hypothetical protein
VDVSAVRDVAAAMHAAAVARVASSRVAASSANLHEQTVVESRGRIPTSVDFDGFGLRRREAQERCDRNPSAGLSETFHLCSSFAAR